MELGEHVIEEKCLSIEVGEVPIPASDKPPNAHY
jgi:hypothetical protein